MSKIDIFSWKYLKRSLSNLHITSCESCDLTSMEVKRQGVRTLKHKSSSSLITVDLSSSRAFIPSARAPQAPTSNLPVTLPIAREKPHKRFLHRKLHCTYSRKNKGFQSRKRHSKSSFSKNEKCRPNTDADTLVPDTTHAASVYSSNKSIPEEWSEHEDTWGALIYILSSAEH